MTALKCNGHASAYKTADLSDQHGKSVQVATPGLADFGGRRSFHGLIETLKVDADFLLVKQMLQTHGGNKVLVIDAAGSLQYAMLGDKLASTAIENQWNGLVINGCIRDSETIGQLPLGVKAIATCPVKPAQDGAGESNIPVTFAGVTFCPGQYVYADVDGILVSAFEL